MKRSSYLMYDDYIPLGRKTLKIWAYGRTKRYVCRVEINAAGMSIHSGKKGGRKIIDLSWERLVSRLKN
jgi:hypothetical protein